MMADGYHSLIIMKIFKISREKGMIVIHENDKKGYEILCNFFNLRNEFIREYFQKYWHLN